MANDYVGWGLILGIEDSLDDFINDATEVVNSLGTGLPPRDLAAFSSQSTEDGIKLTFTPPAQTYIDDGGTNQFAVMPAGVLIRYSDTGYPRTPDEGKFGYDYKPTGDWVTTSQECTIVGLTKDTKYYFTAFPYSTEHVYNKNQVTANRTEMTWVGNKGTISVTVNTPEGYEGTLGEYTITLVDQASDSPQNVEKSATGAGLTQFGGLTAGKSYKVRLSNTDDLQAPPDSEAITIVGGVNYDVTMTYALMYGTITVNVSTQPAGMPIGSYTVTLTPQGGGDAMQQSGSNSQAVVFSNVKNGVVYTVGLSAINHYTANAGGSVTAVGGQNISHNAHYSYSATFAEASWSDIDLISSTKDADSIWSVGDTKTFTTKGGGMYSPRDVVVEIIGFNHDDLSSDGKAGISIACKGVPSEIMLYNSGDYDDTNIYEALDLDEGSIGQQIPDEMRAVIKPVVKKCSSGYVISTYNLYLWPFSITEIFGDGKNVDGMVFSGEGTRYPVFTSQESAKKKKDTDGVLGEYMAYFMRSLKSTQQVMYVTENGDVSYQLTNDHPQKGVTYGFCV